MNFKQRTLQLKKLIKKKGKIGISFKNYMPEFQKITGGIIESTYYGITSFPNVGKTPLTKYLFVFVPFQEYLKRKGTEDEFDIHITYFALEESYTSFMDSIIIYYLATYHKRFLTYQDIMCIQEESKLTEQDIKIIEDNYRWFEEFESKIDLHSLSTNADAIKSIIENNAMNCGEIIDGKYKAKNKIHKIGVIDHISIVQGQDKFKMIGNLSEYILQTACYEYGYSFCTVQQQSLDGESAEYAKYNKNESSITNLGNCRETSRNYHVLIGMDMPQLYGLAKYGDMQIPSSMKKSFRGLKILKNRYGERNKRIGIEYNFGGATFKEINY